VFLLFLILESIKNVRLYVLVEQSSAGGSQAGAARLVQAELSRSCRVAVEARFCADSPARCRCGAIPYLFRACEYRSQNRSAQGFRLRVVEGLSWQAAAILREAQQTTSLLRSTRDGV